MIPQPGQIGWHETPLDFRRELAPIVLELLLAHGIEAEIDEPTQGLVFDPEQAAEALGVAVSDLGRAFRERRIPVAVPVAPAEVDPSRLPPVARQQLRAKTLEVLSELGVPAHVDDATGELVFDFRNVSAALGMTEDEARKTLDDAGLSGELRSMRADRMKPVQ